MIGESTLDMTMVSLQQETKYCECPKIIALQEQHHNEKVASWELCKSNIIILSLVEAINMTYFLFWPYGQSLKLIILQAGYDENYYFHLQECKKYLIKCKTLVCGVCKPLGHLAI